VSPRCALKCPHTDTPPDETSTPFILAHEFFDALPIHVFQNVPQSSIPASSTIMTPTGPITPKHGPSAPGNVWHELVVSPTNPFAEASPEQAEAEAGEKPDFEMTISKSPTPHSLYLPTMSPRYRKLDKTDGAIIEVSPESLAYAADFAVRIGGETPKPAAAPQTPPSPSSSSSSSPSSFKTPEARSTLNSTKTPPPPPFTKRAPSGAALMLDYGTSSAVPANTLRGIRAHVPVSPFVSPGLVDLSADVDFIALAESGLRASEGIEVHGPVEQAFFLQAMGIRERAARLLDAAGDQEETRERLDGGWKRLVDRGDEGMGRIYKVMAFLPYVEGRAVRRPVGFGGGVVG
jgi:NADH dehydrogenase [ubiquinone] 1 alpha subcomplex assembly factor 7